MDAFYAEFGRLVRQARKAKKWNQARLATRIKMSRTAVTNIEGGHQSVPLHVVYELAGALQVDVRVLLPGSGAPVEPGAIPEWPIRRDEIRRKEDQRAMETVLANFPSAQVKGENEPT